MGGGGEQSPSSTRRWLEEIVGYRANLGICPLSVCRRQNPSFSLPGGFIRLPPCNGYRIRLSSPKTPKNHPLETCKICPDFIKIARISARTPWISIGVWVPDQGCRLVLESARPEILHEKAGFCRDLVLFCDFPGLMCFGVDRTMRSTSRH